MPKLTRKSKADVTPGPKPTSDKLKDNRYRLSDEEIELVIHWRNTGTIPSKHTVTSDINATRLQTKLRGLDRSYKTALEEIYHLNERLDLMQSLKEEEVKTTKFTVPSRLTGSESVAFAIGSDWHIEEKVDPSTVNHTNFYNPKEAKRRIRKFFEKVVFLTELSRYGTQIDTLVFALLGDIITGFIHEEGMESNYMTPLQAVRMAQQQIKSGLDFLLEHGNFKKILIPCSFGNHGRTTQRIRFGTAAGNSYEQHMYFTLRDIYANDDRVEFLINNSYLTYLTVFDKYTIRFHHGDYLRYGGGIGGISIPANKAIAQWNKSRVAYLDVFGHFHQMLDGGKFISNGSAIGYNSFALSIKAGYEEPKQAFFLIEKDRGKTGVHPIFVADSQEEIGVDPETYRFDEVDAS